MFQEHHKFTQLPLSRKEKNGGKSSIIHFLPLLARCIQTSEISRHAKPMRRGAVFSITPVRQADPAITETFFP